MVGQGMGSSQKLVPADAVRQLRRVLFMVTRCKGWVGGDTQTTGNALGDEEDTE